MPIERTLSILKPNAIRRGIVRPINQHIVDAGMDIVLKTQPIILSTEKIEKFYSKYKDEDFYQELIEYMKSGPVIAQVLEGKNVIDKYQKLIQKIDFQNKWTNFGDLLHGSANSESAYREIRAFFPPFVLDYIRVNRITRTQNHTEENNMILN